MTVLWPRPSPSLLHEITSYSSTNLLIHRYVYRKTAIHRGCLKIPPQHPSQAWGRTVWRPEGRMSFNEEPRPSPTAGLSWPASAAIPAERGLEQSGGPVLPIPRECPTSCTLSRSSTVTSSLKQQHTFLYHFLLFYKMFSQIRVPNYVFSRIQRESSPSNIENIYTHTQHTHIYIYIKKKSMVSSNHHSSRHRD